MTLLPCHWSPRCGAETRSGKKCRNGAMPNGRCKFHGGKAPSGRANGAFRTGKFTTQAIAERAEAKAMRRAAHAEYLDAVEPYLRFGAKNAFEVKAARRRYDEKMAEASKLELAWMYRHHPVDARGKLIYQPTRRRYRRKRRPTFPSGYPNTNGQGRFTKEAKAARRELRAQIAMVGVKLRMAKIARKALAKSEK
jgi:hypothetical protein